jgi:hypothetical protein
MKKYKSKYLEGKQYYSWEYDEHTGDIVITKTNRKEET